MSEKEVKEQFLRNAIAKAAIYAYCDGYFPDKNGINKKREFIEILSSEEMMAVQPYMDSIKKIASNFTQQYNEIPKPRKR